MQFLPFILIIPLTIAFSLIISRRGWTKLAEYYKDDNNFETEKYGMISFLLNDTSYNKAVTLSHSERGFRLKAFLLFRTGHPTLFIPWSDISYVGKTKKLFVELEEFAIGYPTIATVKFLPKDVKKINYLNDKMNISRRDAAVTRRHDRM